MIQINCPKCNTILTMPSKYIYDGGCPKCGTQFRIRNGKTYEQSQIADNILYSLAILFANIAREDEINKNIYFSAFDNFVNLQTLTKAQFTDINKVFKNEYKAFFRQNCKKIISELKLSIDEAFKTSNFNDQKEYENSIYSLLRQMATCASEINPEQQKILNIFTTIFEFSQDRISNLTPPHPENTNRTRTWAA